MNRININFIKQFLQAHHSSLYRSFSFALVFFLVGCSGSGDDSLTAEPRDVIEYCVSKQPIADSENANPYYNGYRLVKETTNDRYGQGVVSYQYDPTEKNIHSTSNNNSASFTTQVVDDNGLLIGGFSGEVSDSFASDQSYQIVNNNVGQIISYTKYFGSQANLPYGHFERADFLYEQGLLRSVNIVDSQGRIETLTYLYNDESHLLSITETEFESIYYFSCNQQNQITDIYVDSEYTRAGRREIVYDQHGNIITFTSFDEYGQFKSKTEYEYVKTEDVVFNHWLLRLSIGLIPASEGFIH